ncbi:hypothetical protein Micbo1qcDRAFT_155324, partial [Microdochium bolleyi]
MLPSKTPTSASTPTTASLTRSASGLGCRWSTASMRAMDASISPWSCPTVSRLPISMGLQQQNTYEGTAEYAA